VCHRVPSHLNCILPLQSITSCLIGWLKVLEKSTVLDKQLQHVYCDRSVPLSLMLHLFIHSIGTCRMRQFLALLKASSIPLCYISFPYTLFYQLDFHPPSLCLAIYFLVYISALLLSNSYIILFWEFYFLPFSVHAQTNVIYLTLLSLL